MVMARIDVCSWGNAHIVLSESMHNTRKHANKGNVSDLAVSSCQNSKRCPVYLNLNPVFGN